MITIEFTEADTLEQRTETIGDLLRANHCEVTFTKVDGSQRVMPCTLKEGSFPIVESTGTKAKNPNVYSVWCTDKQEWRSFKIMNVTQITVLD
jgi:hypothetical protein